MKFKLLYFFLLTSLCGFTQTDINTLPAKIIASNKDTTKPVLLYISGDGGWNKFSTQLIQEFSNAGYPVIALNAKAYFWERKTPQQTGADIQALLKKNVNEWKRSKVLLLGYSFGADVMPFVYNNIGEEWRKKITYQVLLSPSPKTDFEVHVSEMLGYRRKNGRSVVDEINKTTTCQFLFLFGEDDDNFPMSELKIRNYKNITLPGGHHFDNNVNELVNKIRQELK
ncbi:MAG: hypothetical protein EKK37_08790 [Sphingobacteriales bacterium]|nr:MAG: hypothetical protein EKK37_08790 [Sphingobacteriales bacterium]